MLSVLWHDCFKNFGDHTSLICTAVLHSGWGSFAWAGMVEFEKAHSETPGLGNGASPCRVDPSVSPPSCGPHEALAKSTSGWVVRHIPRQN